MTGYTTLSTGESVWTTRIGELSADVAVTTDAGWTEDSDGYRYTVETVDLTFNGLDTEDGTDDEGEVRGMVAGALRTVRAELMTLADDAAKDELQDAIDLIASTQGGAARVLAMLKANGF